MRRTILAFQSLMSLALLAPSLAAQRQPIERSIAITFDDLPLAEPVPRADRAAVFDRLVESIKRNQVPAIGFFNEAQLYTDGHLDPAEAARLHAWRDAGLELGNHTYSHRDLHRITLAEYEQEILKGETVTRATLAEVGKAPRYFRHPYLHTGLTLAIRDSLVTFLAAHGYRVAPVTDDNSDWIFESAYERARASGNSALSDSVTAAYLPYMKGKLQYWERQSVALFGREIPQILLIHGNRINAEHLDDLVAMLKRRGYGLVTLDAALADSAYLSPDTYAGPAGISWLHRWAITRGRQYVLPAEPPAPEFVRLAARAKSE